MKKYILIAIVSLNTLLLISCGTSSTPTPGPPTKTELISTRPWKFSGAFVSAIDVSNQIPQCQRDNIYTFYALKTGILDEGGLPCNVGDPQQRDFIWDFNLNQTELTLSRVLFNGGSTTFTIVTLNQSSLVLSQEISLSGGAPQTVIVNFIPN